MPISVSSINLLAERFPSATILAKASNASCIETPCSSNFILKRLWTSLSNLTWTPLHLAPGRFTHIPGPPPPPTPGSALPLARSAVGAGTLSALISPLSEPASMP